MRSMAIKLTAAFAAVALTVVLIAGLIAERATTSEFGRYLHGTVSQEQRSADLLGSRYSQNGGWQGVTSAVPVLVRWIGQRMVITDGSGKVVIDSAGRLGPSTTPASPPSADSLPIVADGKTVGTMYVLPDSAGTGPMGGMMGNSGMMGQGRGFGPGALDIMDQMMGLASSPERGFLDAVNRSLWIAGGIALIVALLLGLILGRQITAPLQRLTTAARLVAGGDFSQTVQVGSKDELATLAEAFNTMASSLATNEEQRKRLLSDIAHELRTPLSIVQGNLEGMIDGVVEASPDRLASLREEVLLLNRLVTDLRDISVAESGHLQLRLDSVNVCELIRASASAVSSEAEERGIKLEVRLEDGVPAVTADADRIAQVLRNLVSNAMRYTPAGGTITLSAATTQAATGREGEWASARGGDGASGRLKTQNPEPRTRRGVLHTPEPSTQHAAPGSVLVTVSDTGSGIPAEDLPHVFDRFYRVDKSRTRSSGGTGLGLSVARQLVEAHGGKIWAESQPGRGSAFHFALPATAAAAPVRQG